MGANYNEPDKTFRDKRFHGADRELLAQGKWSKIDLGFISEYDCAARVRQGYLAECRGDCEEAQSIYDSIGFDRVVSNAEGPLADDIVENDG